MAATFHAGTAISVPPELASVARDTLAFADITRLLGQPQCSWSFRTSWLSSVCAAQLCCWRCAPPPCLPMASARAAGLAIWAWGEGMLGHVTRLPDLEHLR